MPRSPRKAPPPAPPPPPLNTVLSTISIPIVVQVPAIVQRPLEPGEDPQRVIAGRAGVEDGLRVLRLSLFRAAKSGDEQDFDRALGPYISFYLHSLAGIKTPPPTIDLDGRSEDIDLRVLLGAKEDER